MTFVSILKKGFDLVGDENVLRPLTYYLTPLLRFKERQKELGIDIPFIFHAGETLGDGNHVDENLFDAILLGTKRIGHGFVKQNTSYSHCAKLSPASFSLAKHPHSHGDLQREGYSRRSLSYLE